MSAADGDIEDRIRARAHQIWEEEGRPEGRDREHWERAEREVRTGIGDPTPPAEPAQEQRDFGDSAGYGSGGSTLDRHDVGDVEPAEDRKPNPLNEAMRD
ncbi:MAG: DUF2934 domain-containing protein [Methylobacteriaceae bacterium]|nr:DUF2934 domain-containing protein [Methylobacteriaceae bacterium]